jgi:hypothetical protein
MRYWTWNCNQKATYYGAKYQCDQSVAGGYTDWRLPTRDEYQTIRTSITSKSACDGSLICVDPAFRITGGMLWGADSGETGCHWAWQDTPVNGSCTNTQYTCVANETSNPWLCVRP